VREPTDLKQVIKIERLGISALLGRLGREWLAVCSYISLGVILAVLLVHPAVEALHFWRGETADEGGLFDAVVGALVSAASPEMLPMTLVVGFGGGIFGLFFALLYLWLKQASGPEKEKSPDQGAIPLLNLISAGEGERMEFKSSLRWDWRQGKVNKQLESVIVKSIAGLLNHEGGVLLIGVGDDGEIRGIERDWQTLNRSNWDGFEQSLINLVSARLGATGCRLIHSRRRETDGKSVCQVAVEKASRPVFCRDGNTERYYVRFGNTTRELNAHESVDHIAGRFGPDWHTGI